MVAPLQRQRAFWQRSGFWLMIAMATLTVVICLLAWVVATRIAGEA